jgi:uncharacterized protein (DUF4415 family)
MRKVAAEKRRRIDFSRARRGPVIKPEPGKTKISIRLDNAILDYFRKVVDDAGGGNYQTLINNALAEHIHGRATLDAVRQVVREEVAPYGTVRRSNSTVRRTRSTRR